MSVTVELSTPHRLSVTFPFDANLKERVKSVPGTLRGEAETALACASLAAGRFARQGA